MRVVIAPDKFRGCLSATEVAQAIARGVRRACPAATIDLAPMADGGEGFVEALVEATGGSIQTARVPGPLGAWIDAHFGLLGDGGTGVVAMAVASGLSLVPLDRRDPTLTTTRGTGGLILAALNLGVDRLVVGIGGSATNDGGAGMAQALGYRLLDFYGVEIGPGGGALDRLDRIDPTGVDPRIEATSIEVACDVANPLCGPAGASHVYGPQKGATTAQVRQLDANLHHFARIIQRDLGVAVLDLAGGGAAGGLGAGLVAFTGAKLRSGIDLVIDAVGLRARLAGADLCFSGEGSLDATTAHGKTVAGVAALARSLGVPTLVLAGAVGPGAEAILAQGVSAYFSICPGPIRLEQALAEAAALLEVAAEQATRAFRAGATRFDPGTMPGQIAE